MVALDSSGRIKGAESPVEARNYLRLAPKRGLIAVSPNPPEKWVGRMPGGESQPGKGLKFVIPKVSYNAPVAMFGVGKRLIASVVEDRCK